MTDYKTILGIIAIVIGFLAYLPYILDVVRGTTKPHIFSWIVWGLLETIAFFAQIKGGGGAGTWVTGFSAVMVLLVMVMAFRSSDKEIKTLDVICFIGAIVGIVLWRLTGNPLTAVILVSLADALGFVPTFRKSYRRPYEETLTEYGLSSLKWIVGIFALQSLTLTTALYPASLIFTNTLFVIMSVIRRKQLS